MVGSTTCTSIEGTIVDAMIFINKHAAVAVALFVLLCVSLQASGKWYDCLT